MLILVASAKGNTGKSTCAVNLACELAGLDVTVSNDRWQGEHSVVLVDADAEGTATRCCSGGHLPVSGERLSPADSKDMDRWLQRMRAVVMEVDYVVVDGPSDLDAITTALVGISDLVVIPCSVGAADSTAIVPILELIKAARATRSDGRPKCLLVPTRVDAGIKSINEIEAALSRFGEPLGPVIRQLDEFFAAFNAGRWIGDFAPESKAHDDIKALAASVDRVMTGMPAHI